jgi:hypothetical protein
VVLVLLSVAISYWMVAVNGREPPYVQMTLASRLTVTHAAAVLSERQIRGEDPLELGARPITVADMRGSFRHDLLATGAKGVCAMHYDYPLSACMLRRFKGREFVMLYNIWLTGWRAEEISAAETSRLCDAGTQEYKVARFSGVWVRYRDDQARVHDAWFEYPDPNYRILQHLYWTNRRQLPCTPFSIREQAEVLRQAALMRENDQYAPV